MAINDYIISTLNLRESMQTMIRHVKNSSSVPSILTVTTAKNVAALTAGRFLHAITHIPVQNAVICHVCLQEHSFRIAN